MNFLNWNTEWAKPETARGRRVGKRLTALGADVVCLTEAYPDILPEIGHVITSTGDTGYSTEDGRRKVLLGSQSPWTEVWQASETPLPGGRFVSGVTEGIRFVGLCIPWKMAHVTSGRKDRSTWQDHLSYLEGLATILNDFQSRPEPLVITGDWNQRIPRTRQPEDAFNLLISALSGLEILTEGLPEGFSEPLIDHLAVSSSLRCSPLQPIPSRDSGGKPLSDHVGFSLEIEFISS